MIDTHSHIDMLDNPSASIQESIEAGVEYIIVPSSSPDNFKNVIELTSYDLIYAALALLACSNFLDSLLGSLFFS